MDCFSSCFSANPIADGVVSAFEWDITPAGADLGYLWIAYAYGGCKFACKSILLMASATYPLCTSI